MQEKNNQCSISLFGKIVRCHLREPEEITDKYGNTTKLYDVQIELDEPERVQQQLDDLAIAEWGEIPPEMDSLVFTDDNFNKCIKVSTKYPCCYYYSRQEHRYTKLTEWPEDFLNNKSLEGVNAYFLIKLKPFTGKFKRRIYANLSLVQIGGFH